MPLIESSGVIKSGRNLRPLRKSKRRKNIVGPGSKIFFFLFPSPLGEGVTPTA